MLAACSSQGETAEDAAEAEVYAWLDSLSNVRSQLPAMDQAVERFMAQWGIKGMQLAVTRNDSLLYARGYGWADEEMGEEMEPYHIMRMASASKLVTAIAIMKLQEQGKLRLDSRVFDILDDKAYAEAMCDPRMADITVDNLLQHMGGFGRGAGDPMFNTADIMRLNKLKTPPTNEELVQIVLRRRIFPPGTHRSYSNFGYFLLSLVIERVAGQNYWEYVEQNVLHPAGCYCFLPATNYYVERNADEVRYYGPDEELVEEWNGSGRMVERVYGGSNIRGLMGAGGWCASAADVARLVAATDKHGRVADVISAASVDSLTAYVEDQKLCRGWSETDAKGKWTRTGTLASTHALIQRFPDGECWVLLTNTGMWRGHHFSHQLQRLVETLRSRYGAQLPRRDLFRSAGYSTPSAPVK